MDKKIEQKTKKKLRILIVEDSEDDALILQRELSKSYEFISETVYAAKTFEIALEKEWDAIISDYQMPAFNALNALNILHQSGKDLPFIIVSGTIGEDIAVEAMKAGAHDYLMKGSLIRLIPALNREIKEATVRLERNKATEDLLTSAQEWQNTFDAICDMVAIIDKDMVIHRANRTMLNAFKGKKVLGEKCFHLIHGREEPLEKCKTYMALLDNKPINFEIVHEGDETQYFDVSLFPFAEKNNKLQLFVLIFRDITDQKRAEEERRQGEKLQALGQLAGGVAHDFNNNLTAIMGYSSLLETMVNDDTLSSHINIIQMAAKRSSELTSKLLAFARKGKYENVPANLNQIVNDVIALLSRSIDKRIKIESKLNSEKLTTLGDFGQISNAVLNIAINARDAMKNISGTITFKTEIADQATINHLKKDFPLIDQPYIALTISDTGTGIDEKIQKQIFDPFFTTKARSQGTGLGLSAAYGTVLNHKGAITVDSTKKGATFSLYFPLHKSKEQKAVLKDDDKIISGTGNVLIIDDEEYITKISSEMLKTLGYNPTECIGGFDGVAFYQNNWNNIDLIILDMIMPGMTGEETFVELQKINPNVKVLISSGYSNTDAMKRLTKMGIVGSMQKPYELNDLSTTIKKAMGENKET